MKKYSLLVLLLLFTAPALASNLGLGPSLSLGFPHFFWLDLNKTLDSEWSVALGAGGLNLNFKDNNNQTTTAGIGAVDARVRWHPYHGALFVGMALGVQSMNASINDRIVFTAYSQNYNVLVTDKIEITSAYLLPHVGWLWMWQNGFMLGFDFGLQVPFSPKTTMTLTADQALANNVLDVLKTTAVYQRMDGSVVNVGNRIGNLNLPYVTALRLGWMF